MSQHETVVMGTHLSVYPAWRTQQPLTGQHAILPAQMQSTRDQTVTIHTVQAPRPGPKVWENYKSKASIWLGGTQIIGALLMIVFNTIGLVLRNQYISTMFVVGHGFWCSPFCLIAGGFGVGAGKHKTTCMIVTTMVMSIISASLALGLVVIVSALGIVFDREYQYEYDNNVVRDYDYDYDDEWMTSENLLSISTTVSPDANRSMKTFKALHGVMLILALVEFVVAIGASALCCAAVCCGKSVRSVTAFHYGPATMPPGQLLKTGGHIYPATQNVASYPRAPTELKGGDVHVPDSDPILPPSYPDTPAEPLEFKG